MAGQLFQKTMVNLISVGRYRDTLALGIKDAQSIAGGRYNGAIRDALRYFKSIE
jgi:hypothetical protein